MDILLPFLGLAVGYFGTFSVDRRKRPAYVGGGIGGVLGVIAMVLI